MPSSSYYANLISTLTTEKQTYEKKIETLEKYNSNLKKTESDLSSFSIEAKNASEISTKDIIVMGGKGFDDGVLETLSSTADTIATNLSDYQGKLLIKINEYKEKVAVLIVDIKEARMSYNAALMEERNGAK